MLDFGSVSTMKRRSQDLQLPVKMKIYLGMAIVSVVLLIAAVIFLVYIIPPKDDIEVSNYPSESFCTSDGNRIDYQTYGKCAAYAASYLLRHLGEDVNGEELASELKRSFGFISANSVADVFNRRGYRAKACRGNLDTLKQQLTKGNPIIVFVGIPKDTHYAVVVGYDERFLYLVDSLKENVNTSNERYNRILATEDFEAIWKTGKVLPDNIYIIVQP